MEQPTTDSSTLSQPDRTIDIFVDGACPGNPGPIGIGIVAYDLGVEVWTASEYHGAGTNNEAELLAIIRAMEMCDPTVQPIIYTDSAYCVGQIEKGYKTTANKELVARARVLKASTSAVVYKVDGHAGNVGNERANKLAQAAASAGGGNNLY